ncbi:MAG TPA: urease accessory protein UreF [Stellaceae bacterium]|jgi:urease accessory protein|nr:urease accessory protein UreF [Stellaceae bacterium]
MSTDNGALYRLLAWASPAFPTGAFSYSHGLEAAAADGAVHDRATLEAWIAATVAHGSGRVDADVLRDAWRAASAGDDAPLAEVNRRGVAYRATAELALESAQQGAAFAAAYEAAWGSGVSRAPGEGTCHAAVFGRAAARGGVSLEDALIAYLSAFAANLMSAGLRLGIIGQTDGQRILAALEPVIARAVEASLARTPEDFGSSTFALDLASMAHETLYSRLFRS